MGKLDIERIAAAGLTVIDEQGPDGLTIRAVARALGVTPMALYNHVENKADLVALVVDTALGEQPMPAPTGEWREDLFALARWVRNAVNAHPAAARLQLQFNVWTSRVVAPYQRWVSLWQQSGLKPNPAGRAALLSSMAVAAFAQQESIVRDVVPPDGRPLAGLPEARSVLGRESDAAAGFDLFVRALVDGLHAALG